MQYGYARVSTDEQEHALQLDALQKAGVTADHIYQDTITGASDPYRRPQLSKLLQVLQPGDELIIWRLDRLGRSARDLIDIDAALKEKSVKLISIREGVDTATPAGKFFYHILASLAQMERELIAERVNAGLAAARKKGKKFGRPRKLKDESIRQIRALHSNGESVEAICRSFGLSKRSAYRALSIEPAAAPHSQQLNIMEVIGAAKEEPATADTRQYHYNGKIIGVMQGLWSGEDGKPVYFVGWDTGTGRHRVKSKDLPPTSKAEAQKNLDAWALKKRLQPVMQDDREMECL